MTTSYQRRPKARKSGCWLVAMAACTCAAALTLIALFLPPFSAVDRLQARQFTPLSAESRQATFAQQLSVRLLDPGESGDFALRVEAMPVADFLEGADQLPDDLQLARQRLPAYLAPRGHIYVTSAIGSLPGRLQFTLPAADDSLPSQTLSIYGWDGASWRFISTRLHERTAVGEADILPGALALFQALPAPPLLMISQELNQDFDPELAALSQVISPAGLRPGSDGGLIGSLAPGADAGSAYRYLPLIRNFDHPRAIDAATIERLLRDPGLRALHISRISDLAANNGFHGVFIDYRDVSPDLRMAFSDFIDQLGESLRARDLLLGIVLPAEDRDAYDWRALAAAADVVKLDLGLLSHSNPASMSDWLRVAVAEIDRYKLLLGLSARSVMDVEGGLSPIGFHQALSALGDVQIESSHISETGTIAPGAPFRVSLNGLDASVSVGDPRVLDYVDSAGQQVARIRLMDARALRTALELARDWAVAGVAFDDLFAADLMPGLQLVLRDYRSGSAASVPPTGAFSARWSITGGAGSVAEWSAQLNDEIVLTLDAPDGHYAVNMAIVDSLGRVSSQREGASLPLYQPTATPTPTPFPTPRPAPVVVVQPTASQPRIPGNFAAVPPPAGSISIEIGGHVTGAGSARAINAMRSAGMTWMKIQARFDRSSPPNVSGEINAAHSSGFKILVGTVGDPGELAQGGEGFINAYTDWLAQIAGGGADAIEVWNEPNLDREWPRGRISGAAYAAMLAQAYQKIKAVNPGVLVISAAPAPTGVSDRPEQVMPDNQWLREMVAAGGLDHLDCVGAHYNEGIVPPDQTSGDPRGDNYYTRYFYGMLNGYVSITRKPICFTELGYLSAEGFGGLSQYFSWADNVTVAQQAAWLAQAAALASRSGQVRLLIVWNVDFTHYGADPQAGYAMIRPDESCPACQTLAGAR